MAGVHNLRGEVKSLRKRNAELEERLASLEQAEDISLQPKRGKKGGPTVASLKGEIGRLNVRIRAMEKAKQKDRKKIEKLRLKEVKAEAAELEDDAKFDVGDTAYRMRKLLRRFHDTILSSSIEESEECPICMDPLQLNKCASLPCEHTFCKSCLLQISPGSEIITCPQCRAGCPRDEIEVVQYTASQQWDSLLEVAKIWAKMDMRREVETSEEEAEDEFLDDSPPEVNTSSSRSGSLNPPAEPGASSPVQQAMPDSVDLPTANAVQKRRISFSAESSPLSQPEDIPEHELDASVDRLNEASETEPIAGPSTATAQAQPPVTPPHADQTTRPTTPSYNQSPAREKRKRLEDLAAARRRKRR